MEITHIQYDGVGILEHKSKMDALCMKHTEAGNPIPETMYLNFFIDSLPEEYDPLVSTVNYELDTVEEVVSNLRQVEMKQGFCTAAEGSAFSVTEAKPQKGKQSQMPQTPAQGARGGLPKKNLGHTSKCYNCSSQGHWAKKFPSPKKRRDISQQKETKKDTPSRNQDKNWGSPSTTHGLFSAIETSMFLGKSPIM